MVPALQASPAEQRVHRLALRLAGRRLERQTGHRPGPLPAVRHSYSTSQPNSVSTRQSALPRWEFPSGIAIACSSGRRSGVVHVAGLVAKMFEGLGEPHLNVFSTAGHLGRDLVDVGIVQVAQLDQSAVVGTELVEQSVYEV